MTQQTQSSLNRVSRLPPGGKRVREPQIELKDEVLCQPLYPSPLIHRFPTLTTWLRMATPKPFKKILKMGWCEPLGPNTRAPCVTLTVYAASAQFPHNASREQ